MQFVYQPLTWAFLAVLIPVAIHLINMMRHRRVQWAAMEFLLASYKKHRRWIWMRQLLLLITRMAAVALLVAMLAQLVTPNQWSNLLGTETTHHVILLDDSLSMADLEGGTEAFETARQAIGRIVSLASNREGAQRFSLIRFSRADRAVQSQQDYRAVPDLLDQLLQGAFEETLQQQGRKIEVTQLAVGPREALTLADQLLADQPHERSVLHLMSDFRQYDWQQPAELRELLGRISDRGTHLHFVRCVDQAHANLSVTDLQPQPGTLAAGVPLMVRVTVQNHGQQLAERIVLSVQSVFHSVRADGSPQAPQSEDLPDVLIDSLRPGESVTKQFQVFFPTTGQHVVRVSLPPDALLADNRRWCVLDLPEGERVLLIDGDARDRSAYYLQSVFEPDVKTKTGVLPEVQDAAFLRDADPVELRRYHAIYLLDVPQLDPRAVENVEQFVRQGGGLAIFAGPNWQVSFYNRWYNSGEGLFPVPVSTLVDVDHDRASSQGVPRGQVRFIDHPMLQALGGPDNPFARSIRIDRYVKVPPSWQPSAESTTQVLSRVDDEDPLIIERRFGEGRVVAFLTSLTPDWNNWALEPSFVVVALQLHAHLADQIRPSHQQTVGQPLTVTVDRSRLRADVLFSVPTADQKRRQFEKTAQPVAGEESNVLSVSLGATDAGDDGGLAGETDHAGIYEVELTDLTGKSILRRYAFNVDTHESDLQVSETDQLREMLDPLTIEFDRATAVALASGDDSDQSWSEILMWLLLGTLLAEQLLAYLTNYHPRRAAMAGGTG